MTSRWSGRARLNAHAPKGMHCRRVESGPLNPESHCDSASATCGDDVRVAGCLSAWAGPIHDRRAGRGVGVWKAARRLRSSPDRSTSGLSLAAEARRDPSALVLVAAMPAARAAPVPAPGSRSGSPQSPSGGRGRAAGSRPTIWARACRRRGRGACTRRCMVSFSYGPVQLLDDELARLVELLEHRPRTRVDANVVDDQLLCARSRAARAS